MRTQIDITLPKSGILKAMQDYVDTLMPAEKTEVTNVALNKETNTMTLSVKIGEQDEAEPETSRQ